MKFRLLATILTLLLITGGVFAQDTGGAVFAAIHNNQLVIRDGQTELRQIPHVFDLDTTELVWSPDGSQLAFVISDYGVTISVVNVAGGDPIVITNATNIDDLFPISWTPNGKILYVTDAAYTGSGDQSSLVSINLNLIAPTANAQPETIASVPSTGGTGCFAGSSWPTQSRYTVETSAFQGWYTTLSWTAYGILYSTSCHGHGYALFDPATGTNRFLFDTSLDSTDGSYISRAALAPDGRTLAAIKRPLPPPSPPPYTDTLVFVDLATGDTTEMTPRAEPKQIGWVGTTLYYSEQKITGNALDSFSPEELNRIFNLIGSPSVPDYKPSYTMYLHAFDPATGEDSVVATVPGFEIGRIRAANGQVWFSVIPNDDAYFRAVLDSQYWNNNDFEALLAAVPVSVYRINEGKVELVGEDLSLFTPR